jgi:hypothetical protein
VLLPGEVAFSSWTILAKLQLDKSREALEREVRTYKKECKLEAPEPLAGSDNSTARCAALFGGMTMIHVETDDCIVTFDGTVVEFFGMERPGNRYHIRYIKKFELLTDRKGRGQLRLGYEGGGVYDGKTATAFVKPEHMGRAEEMVSEVEQAMASWRAGV